MTWAEFRRWALEEHGIELKNVSEPAWRAVVGTVWSHRPLNDAMTGTGSGNHLNYGAKHRRRFTLYLRCRDLVRYDQLAAWLNQAEKYADGWLVNDGSGIRWVERLTSDLIYSGFVGVRCGE